MSQGVDGAVTRRGAACLLALAFFALQVPELFDPGRYHGDERFYTDAAIGMMQSGELLTPRYPDGRLRFEKPLLSYLVLVGSYELFGISVFSSRLPFLLAGALLVLSTWWAGLRLLRDPDAALLAAAIVAACPDFLALAARSTPDILLCLFLLFALAGFALLLRGDGEARTAPSLAWLGAGLAMAVKGGLGAVLVGYVVVLAAASRDRAARLRRLLHPLPALLGLLIAAAGFGTYALVHGLGALSRSVDDQVGGRFGAASELPGHFLTYLAIPFEHLAPWLVLLALGTLRDRATLAEYARRESFLLRYSLGWMLLLVLVFSAADVVRGRYLAPVYPILALGIAGALVTLARRGRATALLRGASLVVLTLVAAGGLALIVLGTRIGAALGAAGLAVTLTAAAGILYARRGSASAPLLALGTALLVIQGAGGAAVRSTFSRSPVSALAARLSSPALAGGRVAQIGESAHLASKLRVATGGRIRIDGYQRGTAGPDWTSYDAIVSDAPLPDTPGFHVERCGESWGDEWTLHEVLDVVRADDPARALTGRSRPYYLAIRDAVAPR